MTTRGANLPRVKKQNESLIKEVIYKYGPISRIEISEMLSLTPPTITTNISAMVEQGLVRECIAVESEEAHSLGRRPVKLNFVEDAFFVAGVEINPYQTAICVVDLRGNIKARMKYPPVELEYKKEMDLLAEKIMETVAESGIDQNRLLGVGLGIPGFVDKKTGVVRKSTLRSWSNQNIAKDLSARLKLPVLLENNARARAVKEEMFSDRKRPDTFAYYLISYGIACPLYINKSFVSGEQQGAGEAGHMVAVLNGPKCETCGNEGCLEEVASERAIVKMVKRAVESGQKSMIMDIAGSIGEITVKDILAAQERGDDLAAEVIGQAIMYLGAMLANVINLINPPLVLVDGYIMKLEENRRQLLENTKKHIFGLYDEEVDIEFVDFDQFTGALGAAALAIKTFFIKG